jgi:hypothetical protein
LDSLYARAVGLAVPVFVGLIAIEFVADRTMLALWLSSRSPNPVPAGVS